MADRSIAPPFVKSVSFELIRPDTVTLPNGLQAYFITGGSQDVVKLEFIFNAGRWFETKTPTAYFTALLLSKGTREKSSFQIASIFDQYGAHLDVSPGLDFVSVSLYALRKNLDTVLDLLMEILTAPSYPQKEFTQARSVFVQNLQVNNEKTSYVASQIFRKNLFGDRHPYGTVVEEKDTRHIGTRDFIEHFNSFFGSPKVFVSGKITPADRELMLTRFSLYPSRSQSLARSHQSHNGPAQEYQEREESVQSSIRTGRRSVLRSHPDYVPILFASHILGGYFGSRLMKNIREEKGLTYGISASIHGMKYDSYLIIGADVNKENTNLTFDEIRKELKRLRTSHISDDELETARNHFIGSLQSEITTPFAHAEKIKTITLYDLATDHYQKIINRIAAITPTDLVDIGERYFHEDTFVQVAVG